MVNHVMTSAGLWLHEHKRAYTESWLLCQSPLKPWGITEAVPEHRRAAILSATRADGFLGNAASPKGKTNPPSFLPGAVSLLMTHNTFQLFSLLLCSKRSVLAEYIPLHESTKTSGPSIFDTFGDCLQCGRNSSSKFHSKTLRFTSENSYMNLGQNLQNSYKSAMTSSNNTFILTWDMKTKLQGKACWRPTASLSRF